MVEKGGEGREVNLLVLIYYDMSSAKVDDLLKEVIVEMGLLESGGLERTVDVGGLRMSGYVVPLDTKYYSTEFTLLTFDGFTAFEDWWTSNGHRQKKIASSIVYVNTDSMMKYFLQTLKALGEFNERTNVETQVLLTCGDPISSLSHAVVVQELCNQQCIEVIELQPTEEAKRELQQYNETFGIKRLVEVLCNTDWPIKNRKSVVKVAEFGPTNGTSGGGGSGTGSQSITIDFGDFFSATPFLQEVDRGQPWPSAEDEVAILKYFGSILQDSSAFPLVENDQASGDSKKKKKKNKKSKQKSPVEDDSHVLNAGETQPENGASTTVNEKSESPLSREESVDAAQDPKATVLLTDILEDVLKINNDGCDGDEKLTGDAERQRGGAASGGKEKKAAAEVPRKKQLKNDIAPVISQLNELKQKAQLLDGEERISLASRVSMSVWEKIANEDDSDDREE